ncbi:hypothetical protein KXD40_002149 [Peronospora effusa]|nr:hypothetical protein KXD40_002149 [Peronospora effusa]
MVKLFCAIVGVRGSAFSISIDTNESVDDLKKAIKAGKANALKNFDAHQLRLFLTKRNGVWLSSSTEHVKKLKDGMMTSLLEELV